MLRPPTARSWVVLLSGVICTPARDVPHLQDPQLGLPTCYHSCNVNARSSRLVAGTVSIPRRQMCKSGKRVACVQEIAWQKRKSRS